MSKDSKNYIAVSPGDIVKELLEERNITQKDFAARIDCTEKHVSNFLSGNVELSHEMAFKLEAMFGLSVGFWNNMEAQYRENLARVEYEKKVESEEKYLEYITCYNEIAKLGWVEPTRNDMKKVINLRKFFEVSSLDLIEGTSSFKIACRKLSTKVAEDWKLLVWAQRARIESRNIETDAISYPRIEKYIEKMSKMTSQSPEIFYEEITRSLASMGVALVVLPHLSGSFLQGATFRDGNRYVVGVTLRGTYADVFWFSLMHELGHIVLGHLKKTEELSDADEVEADRFASNSLIPLTLWKEFIARNNFTKSAVLAFAQENSVDKGIVVGRLQKEQYIPFNRFNDLKTKYTFAS